MENTQPAVKNQKSNPINKKHKRPIYLPDSFVTGSWSGPGAIVTGVLGLTAGVAAGFVTAVSAGAAMYQFFKSAPVLDANKKIIKCSRDIVKEETVGITI